MTWLRVKAGSLRVKARSFRVKARSLGSVLLLLAICNCGGKVSGGESDSDAEAPSPGQQGAGGEPGASSNGALGLPPCEPGFDPADDPNRFCAYVGETDGLCYDTKTAACACECPSTSGTVCSSPLFPPDSKVPVSCS